MITVGFTGIIAFSKLLSKTDYVYAKVKVAQGLWWASTLKTPLWLAQGIKANDSELDLFGKPIAEVIEKRYYPTGDSLIEDKFNVYLTVRLAAKFSKSGKKYTFKGTTLSIGSPIELDLARTFVSGTIIDISPEPFQDKYVEREVTLRKVTAPGSEFNAIKIGDEFSDGNEVVFKVLDKNIFRFFERDNLALPISSMLGITVTAKMKLTVTAKMKLKEKNGLFLLGEDKIVRPGAILSIPTPNFDYHEFEIVSIE